MNRLAPLALLALAACAPDYREGDPVAHVEHDMDGRYLGEAPCDELKARGALGFPRGEDCVAIDLAGGTVWAEDAEAFARDWRAE